MTVRNIKKQLIGMQDILQGVGNVSQSRNSQAYNINRVDVPFAVSTVEEMSALDITLYTRARVYSTTTLFRDYIFDSAAASGVAPDSGTGYWVVLTDSGSSSTNRFSTLANAMIGLLPTGDTVTLAIGDVITVTARVAGNQGGADWIATDATTVTANGTDVIGVSATISLVLYIEPIMTTKQFGAQHDNSTDDSAALLQSLASCKANKFILQFSTGMSLISSGTTLAVSGNMHLKFLAGSYVKMIVNALSVYTMMAITGTSNTVEDLRLIGDKVGHTGAASDTCVGLSIDGSCILTNPDITSCWGDNVVIPFSGRVNISNLRSYYCGGDALVIGDVEDFLSLSGTTSLELSDKHGLAIEPTASIEGLNNLSINSLVTRECGESGVNLDLSAWPNTGFSTTAMIAIGSHKDYGSKTSFNIAPMLLGLTETTAGVVNVVTAVYEQSGHQGLYLDNYSSHNSPAIRFGSLNVINANSFNSTNELEQTAIGMAQSTAANTVGNLTVDHLRVEDNRGTQRCRTAFYADDGTFPQVGFKNVDVTLDYYSLTDTTPVEIDTDIEGITIRDVNKLLDGSAFSSIGSSESVVSVVKSGASALTISTAFGNNFNGNMDIEFSVDDDAGSIRLTPGVAETYLPLSSVAGKYIESTEEGAYLKLRRTDLTTWTIVAQIGTWTVEP